MVRDMPKERTEEEFKESVIKNKITEFKIRKCSFCHYDIKYVFDGDTISLDTGCDCVTYGPVITEISWDDLVSRYNDNIDVPNFISRMDEKFKFNEKD